MIYNKMINLFSAYYYSGDRYDINKMLKAFGYDYATENKNGVVYLTAREMYDDDADNAATLLTLLGHNVIVEFKGIKSEYPAIDMEKLEAILGEKAAAKLIGDELESNTWGYAWFQNIIDENSSSDEFGEDCTEETLELYGSGKNKDLYLEIVVGDDVFYSSCRDENEKKNALFLRAIGLPPETALDIAHRSLTDPVQSEYNTDNYPDIKVRIVDRDTPLRSKYERYIKNIDLQRMLDKKLQDR